MLTLSIVMLLLRVEVVGSWLKCRSFNVLMFRLGVYNDLLLR